MHRKSSLRIGFGVVSVVFALAACKVASGPKPESPPGVGAGGVPVAAAKPVLFADERPVGKLVAFKDGEELQSWNDAWYDDVHPTARRERFSKMEGPNDDAGAPVTGGKDGKPVPVKPKDEPKPPPASPAAQAAAPAPAPVPAMKQSLDAAAARPARAPRANAAPKAEKKAMGDPSSSNAEAANDKSGAEGDSITNNQHAQVDEGDIVKLHGEHLVVLRRGRLFTISLEGGAVRQSKMVDAFGPDIDPRGSWYDEMVVDGDNVVVVGFSYARGGTEIGLFKIDSEGGLTYRATYHLKSNDYYSARNYASRIVDGRLVFYAPLYISPQAGSGDFTSQFPAVRKWRRAGTSDAFVKTLVPTKLYHMDGEFPATPVAALHTVTTCDLRTPELECQSIGMVGPQGRVFYVSPTSVYVWMQDFSGTHNEGPQRYGMLAKLPIDRRANPTPTALRVSGMPTDQFSFDEDDTGHLDVLVRADSNGDAMFASETTSGAMALLRIPLGMFGFGDQNEVLRTSSQRYRIMPRPDGFSVQNRFVNGWLLYGSGQGYFTPDSGRGRLYAARVGAPDEPTTAIDLNQGVDRIEPMADDAVVVGARGSDLVFTPVELGASKEAHARRDYVRKNASQGELRSHGFFYKPGKNPREGLIGLPIRNEGARGGQYLTEGSASVLFLQSRALEFSELGSLRASRLTTNHDGCRASCVDWYGNARPIFAKGRIFALMGYDLVEGQLGQQQGRNATLNERLRINFAPRGGPPAEDNGVD